MQDFILIVIFLVASLASYFGKKKGQKQEELPYDGDIEWSYPTSNPKVKTVAKPQRDKTSRDPEVLLGEPIASSLVSVEKKPPIEAKIKVMRPGLLEKSLPREDNLAYSQEQPPALRKSVPFSCYYSLSKLQEAIIVREILDRPRAYDI